MTKGFAFKTKRMPDFVILKKVMLLFFLINDQQYFI